MRLIRIISPLHLLIAISLLLGLTACGRQNNDSANNPVQEKQTRLAGTVKASLKDNIFLKPLGLELIVIDEKDGFVKLSLVKGSRALRKVLADGADLGRRGQKGQPAHCVIS